MCEIALAGFKELGNGYERIIEVSRRTRQAPPTLWLFIVDPLSEFPHS